MHEGPHPAGRQRPARKLNVSLLVFLLMVAALAVAVGLEWNKAQPALRQASWMMILPAALATFVSLLLACVTYAAINRAFGLPISGPRLVLAGYVNMAVNNLVNLGGVAGGTVSIVLLRRKDIIAHDVLAASLFNSYLHIALGVIVLPPSILFLLLTSRFSALSHLAGGLAFVVSLVIAVAAIFAALHRPARSAIIRFLSRVVHLVSRRDLGRIFADFDSSLTEGLTALSTRPKSVALVLVCHIGCWVFSVIALWFCYRAIGTPPALGVMISGYYIGLAVGAISMVPGGLGTQDGSMAWIYAAMGTPVEISVLASILFRIVYYLLPFVVGLFMYWVAIRQRRKSPAA
jgi:uncharacterized protein (TIRG00374 family)